MHSDVGWLGPMVPLILLAAPLLVALAGWYRARGNARTTGTAAPGAVAMLRSAICYALAYNFVFFWQELWLVLPKAMVPGLNPTLYHNNHNWAGDAPIAALFQGTGAFAILLLGAAALIAARARALAAHPTLHLLIVWIAFHGLLQGLPQLPTAVLDPATDTGQALAYLGLAGSPARLIGLAGLLLIPLAAWAVGGLLLATDGNRDPAHPATSLQRLRDIALLPWLVAAVLIAPFRWPGGIDQMLISPFVVGFLGLIWVAARAFWAGPQIAATAHIEARRVPAVPMTALAALLALFQLVLRPGIDFF